MREQLVTVAPAAREAQLEDGRGDDPSRVADHAVKAAGRIRSAPGSTMQEAIARETGWAVAVAGRRRIRLGESTGQQTHTVQRISLRRQPPISRAASGPLSRSGESLRAERSWEGGGAA